MALEQRKLTKDDIRETSLMRMRKNQQEGGRARIVAERKKAQGIQRMMTRGNVLLGGFGRENSSPRPAVS